LTIKLGIVPDSGSAIAPRIAWVAESCYADLLGLEAHRRWLRRGQGDWQSWLRLVATLAALGFAFQPARRVVAADADFHVGLRYEISGTARGCWSEEEFRRNVAGRIGYDPFRENPAVLVSIHVGGSALAVDGQVEWRNASGIRIGERKFVAKDGDCVGLLTEVSFAVGLQIELLRPRPSPAAGAAASAETTTPTAIPTARAATPPATATPPAAATPDSPPPNPPSSTPLPPSGRPPAAPESASATLEKKNSSNDEPADRAVSSHWPMWVGVGPSLAWGTSPSVTADARLFVGVRHDNRSLEIGAEASYPSTELQWDGTGFRQSLIGASAALCEHRQVLSACVLGKASQVRVAGLGVDNPRSPTGFVLQAGIRVAATLDFRGSWSAAAHLDLLGLLTPYTVDLNQAGVWEMPRVGALAGIDVAARFR
jgi:hypothetical protein